MNLTAILIEDAQKQKGVWADGYRQCSTDIDGICCEIITRTRIGQPDRSRNYFRDGSENISRAEAERRLEEIS